MDYEKWKLIFDVGQFGLTVIVWAYVWWTNRERVTNDKIAAIVEEIASVAKAFTEKLEEVIKDLEGKIASLGKELETKIATLDELFNNRLKEETKTIRDEASTFKHDYERRIDNHAKRIRYLEACAEKAPDHEDLGKVYEAINGVASKVDKQSGQIESVRETLGRINQHLMDQAIVNQKSERGNNGK